MALGRDRPTPSAPIGGGVQTVDLPVQDQMEDPRVQVWIRWRCVERYAHAVVGVAWVWDGKPFAFSGHLSYKNCILPQFLEP